MRLHKKYEKCNFFQHFVRVIWYNEIKAFFIDKKQKIYNKKSFQEENKMSTKIILCLVCFLVAFGICSCNIQQFWEGELLTSENETIEVSTPNETEMSGCNDHIDKNDDSKCDICSTDYEDGCDNHMDQNDDNKCDVCSADYEDGCDNHIDKDDNSKCDICSIDYEDGCDNPLDGKKIIFIGDSYTYYGQTVLEKSQTNLTQKSRSGDKGYFYQLCQSKGVNVEVTNWTFGGHTLDALFGGNCSANRGCDGEDHKAYLTDKFFDYVVIQLGAASSDRFLLDMEIVTSFFKEANPNAQFVVLVPYSNYGTIGSTPTLAATALNNLKTVANDGVIVVDWGGVVMNILDGKTQVPGTNLVYEKNTFVVSKSAKDGYHPNQLSGYITTLMTYCAITGQSAVGQSYDFCNDPSLSPSGSNSKFFNFDKYISTYYIYNGATTNYPEIFASATDMVGIQKLIDEHLAAKAYMEYDYQ